MRGGLRLVAALFALGLAIVPALSLAGEHAVRPGVDGALTASPEGRDVVGGSPEQTDRVPSAKAGGRQGAIGDSLSSVGPWHRQPRWIMLRSVVVPGWGQWANGKHLKALVVAAGEGYLIFRAVDWGLAERDARDLARAAADDPNLAAQHKADAEYAATRRRDFTWWSIFAAALSMGDAYVDAHLGSFDVEFEPQDEIRPASGRLDSPAIRFAERTGWRLGVRIDLP